MRAPARVVSWVPLGEERGAPMSRGGQHRRTESETHSILTLQGAWSFRLERSKGRPTARL